MTKDKFTALSAGMSGFDGMVKGFGDSNWHVLIGKKLAVVPDEAITLQATRLSLICFNEKMEELKKRAINGGRMGNLDDIISRLIRKRK